MHTFLSRHTVVTSEEATVTDYIPDIIEPSCMSDKLISKMCTITRDTNYSAHSAVKPKTYR